MKWHNHQGIWLYLDGDTIRGSVSLNNEPDSFCLWDAVVNGKITGFIDCADAQKYIETQIEKTRCCIGA